jgi:hypothetical protein
MKRTKRMQRTIAKSLEDIFGIKKCLSQKARALIKETKRLWNCFASLSLRACPKDVDFRFKEDRLQVQRVKLNQEHETQTRRKIGQHVAEKCGKR